MRIFTLYVKYSMSKTPIYLGKGNIRGKSGFAVNRGFACLQYLGEEIGRGKSGFAVNRGSVNRGFTVIG